MIVHQLIVLAATDPEDRGGLEVILPPAAELFWGAVAFAIVYLLVAKLAFPKINELLEERAASIQGKMAEADEQLEEAERTRAQYDQKLREAKDEAYRIVEDARESAESVRREIIERAEREAEQILERAQNEIAAERDRAIQQLRGEVSRLAVELAERIVQRELDESAHEDLIDNYIDQLATTNGDTAPAGERT
jgi:F-type H+-transporting ATPase subunit b